MNKIRILLVFLSFLFLASGCGIAKWQGSQKTISELRLGMSKEQVIRQFQSRPHHRITTILATQKGVHNFEVIRAMIGFNEYAYLLFKDDNLVTLQETRGRSEPDFLLALKGENQEHQNPTFGSQFRKSSDKLFRGLRHLGCINRGGQNCQY